MRTGGNIACGGADDRKREQEVGTLKLCTAVEERKGYDRGGTDESREPEAHGRPLAREDHGGKGGGERQDAEHHAAVRGGRRAHGDCREQRKRKDDACRSGSKPQRLAR
jgi:hypothetical protein